MTDEDAESISAARRRALSPILINDEFQPLSALVTVEFGAASRAGHDRASNEDHFLILRLGRHQEVVATSLLRSDLPQRFEECGYAMLVADGSGRQGAGALASRVAISTLAHLALHHGQWNLRIDGPTAEAVLDRAEWFYQHAAQAVERRGQSDPSLADMCTTLTLAFSAGDELFYAHVGHSRAYLFRDGELTQLTRDHTLDRHIADAPGPVGMPAGANDLRQILTDAMGGGRGTPAVDVERFHLIDADTVLLCTDGLTSVVDDDTIAEVLATPRALDEQCRQLLDLARDRGTRDDATALLARYVIPSDASRR